MRLPRHSYAEKDSSSMCVMYFSYTAQDYRTAYKNVKDELQRERKAETDLANTTTLDGVAEQLS